MLFFAAVPFWAMFGLAVTANLMWGGNRTQMSPSGILVFAFGASLLWTFLTPAYVRLVHQILDRMPRRHVFVLLPLIGVGVGLFVATTISGLCAGLERAFHEAGFETRGFWIMVRYRSFLDVLASFVVLMAGIALNYLQNLQVRQKEAAILRTQLVESRLAVLRTQLNPHFLFNTLNAVGAVAQHDPKRAQRILAQLSDLLRYMLDETGEEEVPLREEFQILKRYFDILDLRYEGWLKTSISSAAEIQSALVPNLILQPLAENALTHGVGPAGGAGWIRAEAARDGDWLVLTITDSGPGKAKASRRPQALQRVGGFGIRHTRERLEELYGDAHSFQLAPTPGGGMTAEIRIPFHTEPITTYARVQVFNVDESPRPRTG